MSEAQAAFSVAGPSTEADRLAPREHWDEAWSSARPHDYEGPVWECHALLDRLLPRGKHLRALEIGCAPGFFLAYLHKEFGYRVAGLDYSEPGLETARQHFLRNGIDGDLRCADLFRWDPPTAPYDVVVSRGFVEHFADLRGVLRRHVACLRPGGVLVVNVPNVRGVHESLMRWLMPENYALHNASSCSPWALRSALESVEPGWRYLYCGYGVTFRCFYETPRLVDLFVRGIRRVLRGARLDRRPNRWFSPDAYVIARRPRKGEAAATLSRA